MPSRAEFVAAAASQRVVTVWWEFPWERLDPLEVFRRIGSAEGSVIVESDDSSSDAADSDGYVVIGVDPIATMVQRNGVTHWFGRPPCTAAGGSAREALAAVLAQLSMPHCGDSRPINAGVMGILGADALRMDLPDRHPKDDDFSTLTAAITIPQTIVVWERLQRRLRLIRVVFPRPGDDCGQLYDHAETELAALRRTIGEGESAGLPEAVPVVPPDSGESLRVTSMVSDEDYRRQLVAAIAAVAAGEVKQLAVSRRYEVETDADPLVTYRMLRMINPSPHMYLMRLPGVTVVGSSPQTVLLARAGRISAEAVAGSRPRGVDGTSDEQQAVALRTDAKERAEHEMVVEATVDALVSVAVPGTVQRSQGAEIAQFSHVMHLLSRVTGRLMPERGILEAIAALVPAATVCGVPRPRSQQLGAALELRGRGLYGGCVGFIDFAGDADLALGIRTIMMHNGGAQTQSGASVIAGSVAEREACEGWAKARAVFAAVAAAESVSTA
jgi:anthranilate synthase component I